jgi:hypothetical protein
LAAAFGDGIVRTMRLAADVTTGLSLWGNFSAVHVIFQSSVRYNGRALRR